MKAKSKFGDVCMAKIERSVHTKSGLKLGGVFIAECERDGKIIWREEVHNIATNEGLDAILDIMFHASTQITTWYLLLTDAAETAAAGMTYGTPVFSESSAYTEANRPAWGEGASSSQSMTNATAADFTSNATTTFYGAALVGGGTDADTKDDQAGGGTLYAYSEFPSERSVVSGDVVHLTYTLTSADN